MLLTVATRYGFHRDELYFLEAGRHLAWGYVDQPPFTPVVARVSQALLGEGVWAIRILPALATAATVVIVALLARELGGGRRAQLLGAAAFAFSGFALGAGHLLATSTFDLLAWIALIWLGARLLRTGDPRWWVPFGAVAGAALLNKHLVPMLAVALATGMAVDRRWRLLLSPWAGLGAVLAGVIALPTLLWQATNGWPQVEMAEAIAKRIGGENRALLLPGQVFLLGPLLLPLLVAGVAHLLRPEARSHRPLLWAWPAAVVLTFVTAGRPYYPLPLAFAVAVAGAVAVERWSRDGRRVVAVLVAVNAVLVAAVALPLLPPRALADVPLGEVNDTLVETVGWPELARQVAAEVDRLPAGDRDGVILLAATYGEAGALDRFGPALGLPRPYSPHNSYWHWRRPDDPDALVLAVRYPVEVLERHFESCRQVGRVDNGIEVSNEVQGTPIVVCEHPIGGWERTWPALKRYS